MLLACILLPSAFEVNLGFLLALDFLGNLVGVRCLQCACILLTSTIELNPGFMLAFDVYIGLVLLVAFRISCPYPDYS